MTRKLVLPLAVVWALGGSFELAAQQSVARQWNETLLDAIRVDFARPTVHARNLFHTAIAMYDAWAVYDEVADTYFLGKTLGGYTCAFKRRDGQDRRHRSFGQSPPADHR